MNNSDYISQLNMEELPLPDIKSENIEIDSFGDLSFFDFDSFPLKPTLDQPATELLQSQQTINEPSTALLINQQQNDVLEMLQQHLKQESESLDQHLPLEQESSSKFSSTTRGVATPASGSTVFSTSDGSSGSSISSLSSLSGLSSLSNATSRSPTSSIIISNMISTETDKKKRNTAASARFRVKKKMREQEMERSLKELTERVHKYNARIQQLEMENQCLKSLIIEKNERKSNDMLKSIKMKSITESFKSTI